MMKRVATYQNNMHGKERRSSQREEIACIEARESARWNSDEVKSRSRSQRAEPDPLIHAALPEHGHQDRNKNYARSGDERGLGRSRVQQAERLERVAAEHEEADLRPGPEFLAAESAKGFPEDRRHQERCHGEARRHEGECRGVRIRVPDEI